MVLPVNTDGCCLNRCGLPHDGGGITRRAVLHKLRGYLAAADPRWTSV
jgi:hypothetical protein